MKSQDPNHWPCWMDTDQPKKTIIDSHPRKGNSRTRDNNKENHQTDKNYGGVGETC